MKLNFARNFVSLRKKNHMTQEAIAEKCGMTRSAIAKWECGGSLPDISMIAIICEIFEVSADNLLFDDLYEKQFEESLKESYDSELMVKVDQILYEVKKNDNYKARNLYDGYTDNNRPYADIECESEAFYDAGWEMLNQGHLSDALDYFDRAAEYGNISAIMLAISVRKEIMDLIDGENWKEYMLQLSDFGEKIQQYGKIIQDVQKSRFN